MWSKSCPVGKCICFSRVVLCIFLDLLIYSRKEKEGVLDKSFEVQDYEKIKEWLEG